MTNSREEMLAKKEVANKQIAEEIMSYCASLELKCDLHIAKTRSCYVYIPNPNFTDKWYETSTFVIRVADHTKGYFNDCADVDIDGTNGHNHNMIDAIGLIDRIKNNNIVYDLSQP